MGYREFDTEINEELEERLSLVLMRIKEIRDEEVVNEPYREYFSTVAQYLLIQAEVFELAKNDKLDALSYEKAIEINDTLYNCIKDAKYDTSFANPSYAVKILGEEYGPILCSVFAKIIGENTLVFEGCCKNLCIYAELLVELYSYFADESELTYKEIYQCVYSFMHDYSELFLEHSVERMLNPDFDYFLSVVMDSDLDNDKYLYKYGLNVSKNEKDSWAYLNKLSEDKILSMADTFTEGYRIGFETCNKDITKKSVVEIVYPIGFERVIRKAVANFEKIGLKSICKPFSTSANKQFDYDHKEDAALWLDKSYNEYRIECIRNAFEKNKEIAPCYGGPAVIEIFGEEPFSPKTKEENPKYSKKQQQLFVSFKSEQSQIINKYIHGEERSFTIIAFPVSSIGDDYEDIFQETVKINTLDYILYRDMQQKIIDVLDTADKVHIVGANGNKTDLYINICELSDASKETAFENCVADVNIPVGEVFTTPVLEGTNGKLHVSQVFLNELNYLNLEIDFKDGLIDNYTCTNFANEEENKKYIKDNILFHHDTLPMGEFAIGTNTTAYRMAKVYDIADKLPILIAEKTGPHFAVGDTCYTYDEDNITYNPDGKAIVARDNSVSILRKTDISKAYYNCHTDITIPYNELGAITVICKDGSTKDIIRDGKFVIDGTEELNIPLENL
ncbi:MAG: aminopeptidase [Agathobacter sp.]|nr:aminopeptidase [Agathobacter sp.]